MTPTGDARGLSRITRRLLVVGAVLAVAGCDLPWVEHRTTAGIEGYRLGPAPDRITVVYGTGPADRAGVPEVLEQSVSRVKVKVTYIRANGSQPANLVFRDVVVPLDAPLGSRSVLDEWGREVPRR